jgi:hypothetical protein
MKLCQWRESKGSPVDEVVPVERKQGEFERGFASKEARGLPSSQTATTIAADMSVSTSAVAKCSAFGFRAAPDSYEALPVELRLLALGLPVPEKLARAA